MLTDPSKRFTAQQVLEHTWVQHMAPNSKDCILKLNTDNMRKYQTTNKLQKAVLTFIASRLKEDEIKHLKEIFLTLDSNKDGCLSLEEIKNGITKLKDNNINVEEIFKSIDTDGSGVINYTGIIELFI
jgi:calcium-dependent protein kinase